jgi:hypothetical protein
MTVLVRARIGWDAQTGKQQGDLISLKIMGIQRQMDTHRDGQVEMDTLTDSNVNI